MDRNIIYLIIMWGGGAAFLIIGAYAMRRKKPMWFSIGPNTAKGKIKDIPAYNKALGKMWCLFSIPLWISGIITFFFPAASIIVFAVFCILGIGAVAWWQSKIEEKYITK